MNPVRSTEVIPMEFIKITLSSGAVYQKSYADIQNMLAQPGANPGKVRQAVREELAAFLDVPTADINNKVLFDLASGLSLTLVYNLPE